MLSWVMIIGVDEAGRGPLAGPVVAGAVILPQDYALYMRGLPPLTDSKKLSAPAREALYSWLTQNARCGVGMASVQEITEHNILGATHLAMQRAVRDCLRHTRGGTPPPHTEIWIDGNSAPNFVGFAPPQIKTFIGGDAEHPVISAASILAKVTRDAIMTELDLRYPHYGFAEHKGYGTNAHRAAIVAHGPCPEHRPLFLRNLLAA